MHPTNLEKIKQWLQLFFRFRGDVSDVCPKGWHCFKKNDGRIVRNHFKLIEGDGRGLSHLFTLERCDMIKKTSAMKVDHKTINNHDQSCKCLIICAMYMISSRLKTHLRMVHVHERTHRCRVAFYFYPKEEGEILHLSKYPAIHMHFLMS